jgi:putative oxidoreductase
MNPKSPVVPIARLLLALMFVMAGASKFAGLGGTAGYIASKGLPLPMVLAFATAALELLGGLAIIVGFHARIAAIALALFTLAASFVFHNFWAVPADQQMVQQLMFMKNLSVAGGLFIVAALGAGPASVDARRAPKLSLARA